MNVVDNFLNILGLRMRLSVYILLTLVDAIFRLLYNETIGEIPH